jgi:hypothetical protein
MTASTASLSERYIRAALSGLPPQQREDIERELRTSIADAIDARVEAGSDAEVAEREALTELGDPARLAAGYADRPLHLIGPALYLDYKRLLTTLLCTVVPLTAAAIAVVRTIEGRTPFEVIGGAFGTALTTAVHIAFWVTVLFAILERTRGTRWTPTRQWTPDLLPEPPSHRARVGELIGETVAGGIFLTAILLTPVLPFATDAEDRVVGVLSPWLWDSGAVYAFVAFTAAGLVFGFVRYYVRWNPFLAIGGGLINLVAAGVLIWIATSASLINPAFAQAQSWPSTVSTWTDVGLLIAAAISVVVTLAQVASGFVTRSWSSADLGSMIRTSVAGLAGPNRR